MLIKKTLTATAMTALLMTSGAALASTYQPLSGEAPDAMTPGMTGTAEKNNQVGQVTDVRNCDTSGAYNVANDASPDAMTPGCTGSALQSAGAQPVTDDEELGAVGVYNPAVDAAPDAQTPGQTGIVTQ